MCGRYTLNKTADDVVKRFNIANRPIEIHPNYNVSPRHNMPVITENKDGKRQLEQMLWGIPRILGKTKDGEPLIKELINTRSDKAFGGFWKRTVLNHRCLIPATGFYEWKKAKDGKIPFYIHPKDAELYAFAGIWDVWTGKDGQEIKTYSIMTTEPNNEMKAVHNRMPVILHPEDEASWLEPAHDTPEALGQLLLPYEDNGLEIYEVSRDVNSPRNNDASLLVPVAAQ